MIIIALDSPQALLLDSTCPVQGTFDFISIGDATNLVHQVVSILFQPAFELIPPINFFLFQENVCW